MTRISRRALLRSACIAPLGALQSRAPSVKRSRSSDARIVEVTHEFERFQYRAPYQFGGRSVDRVTILNVNCRIDDPWQRLGVSCSLAG